jgi:hypothetical protein
MKKSIVLFCILLLGSKSFSQNTDSDRKKINSTLDSWHKAAANAEFDNYFSFMTSNGIFIGTDATENWQIDAFKAFSKPYFDKGKAWNFTSLQRNIYFDKTQNTAWFDELLDTQMKICRGSGVLIREGNNWKIAHYVLSMTVPNDNSDEIVKVKEKIENDVLEKLKAK